MSTIRSLVTLTACLLVPSAVLAGPDRWVHLEVRDAGGSEVSFTLPVAAIETVAAFVPDQVSARTDLTVDGESVDFRELAELWKQARRGRDMTFVTVRERGGETVRIAKMGSSFVLRATDAADTVEIRMPARAVDALFADLERNGGRLDIAAMLYALADHGSGELLTVSGDDRVRIWIDDQRDSR